MRNRFRSRRDLIVRLLNQVPGFACASPGGAFYAWPNVTEACALIGAKDSEELRKRLLHEAGVAVLATSTSERAPKGRPAHPLLLRGQRGADRARRGAHRRLRPCQHQAATQMKSPLDTSAARAAIFHRIRTAHRGRRRPRPRNWRRSRLLARHPQGPRPAIEGDLRLRLRAMSERMSSTVDEVPHLADAPAAAARYLAAQQLPMRAVIWPHCRRSTGPAPACGRNAAAAARRVAGRRPGRYHRCFCAFAETGTIVLASGRRRTPRRTCCRRRTLLWWRRRASSGGWKTRSRCCAPSAAAAR